MERDRFVFGCLHSALKVSACGLRGCKSALIFIDLRPSLLSVKWGELARGPETVREVGVFTFARGHVRTRVSISALT